MTARERPPERLESPVSADRPPTRTKRRLRNAKAKGNRREAQSRQLLEQAGYNVTRAAGSLGAWDLVAIGSADVLLVQVKSNRPPRPAERAELRAFRCPRNCRRVIHVWRDRSPFPVISEL